MSSHIAHAHATTPLGQTQSFVSPPSTLYLLTHIREKKRQEINILTVIAKNRLQAWHTESLVRQADSFPSTQTPTKREKQGFFFAGFLSSVSVMVLFIQLFPNCSLLYVRVVLLGVASPTSVEYGKPPLESDHFLVRWLLDALALSTCPFFPPLCGIVWCLTNFLTWQAHLILLVCTFVHRTWSMSTTIVAAVCIVCLTYHIVRYKKQYHRSQYCWWDFPGIIAHGWSSGCCHSSKSYPEVDV